MTSRDEKNKLILDIGSQLDNLANASKAVGDAVTELDIEKILKNLIDVEKELELTKIYYERLTDVMHEMEDDTSTIATMEKSMLLVLTVEMNKAVDASEDLVLSIKESLGIKKDSK